MSTNDTNASNSKLDVIVEAMADIARIEAEINSLETMQNSTDATDRSIEAGIDALDAIVNGAKDMLNSHIRNLSPEELRLLDTRTRI